MTKQKSPFLALIRGLPGAYKTTIAERMCNEDPTIFHVEADDYWIRPDGFYDFNPQRIGNAHKWCQEVTKNLLEGRNKVVVSNTFTRLWEMEPYLQMAKTHNINVVVFKAIGEGKSVHNVPEETIEKMKKRWEDYPGEIEVT